MATEDKKISQMTEVTTADASAMIPIVQGGANRKVTKANLLKGKADAFTLSPDLAMSAARELSVTDKAKRQLFDDKWISACGVYGTVDHSHYENGVSRPYYLNELWLTYEEALDVVKYSKLTETESQSRVAWYGHSLSRTLLPIVMYGNGIPTDVKQCFIFSRTLETIRFHREYALDILCATEFLQCFYYCDKLKKVFGTINLEIGPKTMGAFYRCYALESVSIQNLKTDISFGDSPLLSLASLQYLVTNAANTTKITVTVHPNVYAKLTGSTTADSDRGITPEAAAIAAALPAAELAQWTQLASDASAKDISFATPKQN